MDNVNFMEWDLNLFLPDDVHVREDQDLYTVQPSAYIDYEDGRSERFYLESIELDLSETRMLKPDFPIDFWGADFFISLETFGFPKETKDFFINQSKGMEEIC